jgi:hypothetical protein
MREDPETTRLNIRHYQELLKLDRHTPEIRQRVIGLLAEAQAQLPVDEAEVSSRKRCSGLFRLTRIY